MAIYRFNAMGFKPKFHPLSQGGLFVYETALLIAPFITPLGFDQD
jgi:hypothetical protein